MARAPELAGRGRVEPGMGRSRRRPRSALRASGIPDGVERLIVQLGSQRPDRMERRLEELEALIAAVR